MADDSLSPLEEERFKWLFGKAGDIDEVLGSADLSAKVAAGADSELEKAPEAEEPVGDSGPMPVEAAAGVEPEESELALEEIMNGPTSDAPPDESPWPLPDPIEGKVPDKWATELKSLSETPPQLGEMEAEPAAVEPAGELVEAAFDVSFDKFLEVEPVPQPEMLETEPAEVEPEPLPKMAPQPPKAAPDVSAGVFPGAGEIPQPEGPEAEAIEPAPPEGKSKLPSWIAKAEGEAAVQAPAAAPAVAPAEDLKSAPVDDWSFGTAEETVRKTAEMLATKSAPFSALPAAEKPMRPPSPVSRPSTAEPLEIVEAPEVDEEQVVLGRITEARRMGLMIRIDGLLNDIYEDLSAKTGKNTLEEALKLLKTARHTLVENPRDYDTAEYYTYRAKMLIDRYHSAKKDSYGSTGWGVMVYEGALAILAIFALIAGQGQIGVLVRRGVPEWVVAPWTTMMVSMIGAICGAIWAFVDHTAIKQDFSKQHRWWYIGAPLTGMLLGAVVFYMMNAGALVGAVGGEETGILEPNFFLLTLAWLVGFQQNVALDLFERFLKLIRPAKTEQA